MLFSSISFLYYFLPAVLVIYFLVPFKFKNLVLLLSSLVFYFCGEPIYSLLMIGSSLSGWLHGLWIGRAKTQKIKKLALISSLVFGLGALGFFKYSDFFIANFNAIFGTSTKLLALALPIGISFYTFQILSYTIDVYRGEAGVQKNFLNFAAYVTLFPQLIAGPIVRYTTIEHELSQRTHSFDMVASGIGRFVVGLAKKVLIANVLGELVDFCRGDTGASVLLAWMGAIAYTLHIYFDFSGYSDMAIGLGRIFGFNFNENFNYPYISKSVTEFWRRWHISLGSWFRDYVYIPLGGNRAGKLKWLRNILIVWLLTGFWHGAEWNFIVWGLFYGVLLMAEKLFLGKWLKKLPGFFQHLYALLAVVLGFVIFDATGMADVLTRFGRLFGAGSLPIASSEALYYLRSYAVPLLAAAIGCTPLPKLAVEKLKAKKVGERVANVLEPVFLCVLLISVTAFLIDGSFNPFLYFRF